MLLAVRRVCSDTAINLTAVGVIPCYRFSHFPSLPEYISGRQQIKEHSEFQTLKPRKEIRTPIWEYFIPSCLYIGYTVPRALSFPTHCIPSRLNQPRVFLSTASKSAESTQNLNKPQHPSIGHPIAFEFGVRAVGRERGRRPTGWCRQVVRYEYTAVQKVNLAAALVTQGHFLRRKKITNRDLFVVNRDFFCHDSPQKDHDSGHEFLCFSLKKYSHDSRHFVVARYMPDQDTT